MNESYSDALNVKLKNIYTDPSNWKVSAQISIREETDIIIYLSSLWLVQLHNLHKALIAKT